MRRAPTDARRRGTSLRWCQLTAERRHRAGQRAPDGRVVAKTDLGIPSVRLGLEAHSRRFHFGPDAELLDEQRDIVAATCGWELLYLGWYATRRPAEVLAVVKQVIATRRRGH